MNFYSDVKKWSNYFQAVEKGHLQPLLQAGEQDRCHQNVLLYEDAC